MSASIHSRIGDPGGKFKTALLAIASEGIVCVSYSASDSQFNINVENNF